MAKEITLPLESTIYLAKNGEMHIEHTKMVTGEVGQAFSEAVVNLMGGSVEELIKVVEPKEVKETG